VLRALDQFDQAPICTIHAFCRRVLAEYAFENGEEFAAELASEMELVRSGLREVQRRRWPEVFAEHLADLLELSGYAEKAEQWEERLFHLARHCRREAGRRLLPAVEEDWQEALRRVSGQVLEAWRTARAEAARLGPLDAPTHPWLEGFARLDFNPRERGPRLQKVLAPLLQWLADTQVEQAPLQSWRQFCADIDLETFATHGFRLLTSAIRNRAAQASVSTACPGLSEAVEALEAARSADLDGLGAVLLVYSTAFLQEHLAAIKRERGLITYDDMLTRLDEALDPSRNPHAPLLLHALRSRYDWAVVDEFQDTDPVQWSILRKVFVQGTDKQRLIVVGDPKQAIYAFRGADLQTYKTATAELCERHAAARASLDVNWRSTPELLTALNRLFTEGRFFPEGDLSYEALRSPGLSQNPPNKLAEDGSGRPPLSVVDLREESSGARARRRFARFTAGEIVRLLGGGTGNSLMRIAVKRGPPRPLHAGDICILIRKRSEAPAVEAALRQASIPYTFMKQTGLWDADEARHLGYVLQAIARPDDELAFRKALLTRFFRFRPRDLTAGDLPGRHPARQLRRQWHLLAGSCRWAELFQSILEDSGVLFHDLDAPDADRRLANLRYITQQLAQEAYAGDLDLFGILDRLAELRRQPPEDDSGLQPVETERDKVRISTVHAAKGLEFPVVFLAGGFTHGKGALVPTYRDDDGLTLVFDLGSDKEVNARADAEREAEDRRLLYVALTRAAFKLYVPWLDREAMGRRAGPVASLLGPAIQGVWENGGPPHLGVISAERDRERPQAFAAPALARPGPVRSLSLGTFPPLPPELANRRLRMQSFSRLVREEAEETPLDPRAEDLIEEADADPRSQGPRFGGAAFGSICHEVLQGIDFEEVAAAADEKVLLAAGSASRQLIDACVERHWALFPAWQVREAGAREACAALVAELTWRALHTPLAALGGPLCMVPRQDRLHEVEFLFRAAESADGREAFMVGVMDLVVRRGGKLFLVDWKTNDLAGDYSAESVRQNMVDSRYNVQYRLYLCALANWLAGWPAQGGAARPRLAGVYYLYLRGLNGRDQQSGVFFHEPADADFKLLSAVSADNDKDAWWNP